MQKNVLKKNVRTEFNLDSSLEETRSKKPAKSRKTAKKGQNKKQNCLDDSMPLLSNLLKRKHYEKLRKVEVSTPSKKRTNRKDLDFALSPITLEQKNKSIVYRDESTIYEKVSIPSSLFRKTDFSLSSSHIVSKNLENTGNEGDFFKNILEESRSKADTSKQEKNSQPQNSAVSVQCDNGIEEIENFPANDIIPIFKRGHTVKCYTRKKKTTEDFDSDIVASITKIPQNIDNSKRIERCDQVEKTKATHFNSAESVDHLNKENSPEMIENSVEVFKSDKKKDRRRKTKKKQSSSESSKENSPKPESKNSSAHNHFVKSAANEEEVQKSTPEYSLSQLISKQPQSPVPSNPKRREKTKSISDLTDLSSKKKGRKRFKSAIGDESENSAEIEPTRKLRTRKPNLKYVDQSLEAVKVDSTRKSRQRKSKNSQPVFVEEPIETNVAVVSDRKSKNRKTIERENQKKLSENKNQEKNLLEKRISNDRKTTAVLDIQETSVIMENFNTQKSPTASNLQEPIAAEASDMPSFSISMILQEQLTSPVNISQTPGKNSSETIRNEIGSGSGIQEATKNSIEMQNDKSIQISSILHQDIEKSCNENSSASKTDNSCSESIKIFELPSTVSIRKSKSCSVIEYVDPATSKLSQEISSNLINESSDKSRKSAPSNKKVDSENSFSSNVSRRSTIRTKRLHSDSTVASISEESSAKRLRKSEEAESSSLENRKSKMSTKSSIWEITDAGESTLTSNATRFSKNVPDRETMDSEVDATLKPNENDSVFSAEPTRKSSKSILGNSINDSTLVDLSSNRQKSKSNSFKNSILKKSMGKSLNMLGNILEEEEGHRQNFVTSRRTKKSVGINLQPTITEISYENESYGSVVDSSIISDCSQNSRQSRFSQLRNKKSSLKKSVNFVEAPPIEIAENSLQIERISVPGGKWRKSLSAARRKSFANVSMGE